MKRPKKEPDPDGLGDYGNSNSGYSHYNNGNLENGNNGGVPAMDMDFHSQPPSLKVEPMDTYERNNGSPAHLNANRPQVGFLSFYILNRYASYDYTTKLKNKNNRLKQTNFQNSLPPA